jgi:hypothetical protein
MSFLIDDFTTGPCSISIVNGFYPQPFQAGSMVGGGRAITLNNANNARSEAAYLDVGSANHLNLTVGAKDYVALQISYGSQPDGAPDKGKPVPLGINLDQLGSAIRTNFAAANGVYAINFNVLLYTPAGWSQGSQNIAPQMDPFSFDLPFSAFGGPGGQDFSNVSFIVLLYQTWASLAIDSFEIV